MKKNIAWFAMIPVCIIALYLSFLNAISVPQSLYCKSTSLNLFVPAFFTICLCNILLHLIASLFAKKSNNKYLNFITFLYNKKDKFIIKFFKFITYIIILILSYGIFLGVLNKDLCSAIWNALAIIIAIFYVTWFSSL